jgi:CBS domain-containing protein
MTTPPVCVGLGASLPAAARLMSDHDITRLVVLNADDTLAGIVTRSDLLRVFLTTDEQLSRDGFLFTALSPGDVIGWLPGRSLIDGERLFYDGNSQGGIMGGALTAFAPDYTRAVLGADRAGELFLDQLLQRGRQDLGKRTGQARIGLGQTRSELG